LKYQTGATDFKEYEASSCLCRNDKTIYPDTILYFSEFSSDSNSTIIPDIENQTQSVVQINDIQAAKDTFYTVTTYDTLATGSIDTLIDTITQVFTPINAHYLCVNCPQWRKVLKHRLREIGSYGVDLIHFDVQHMPDEGCWCKNCIKRWGELNCPNDGSCVQNYFNPSQAAYHYLGVNISFLPNGDTLINFNTSVQNRMSDFMDISLREHFVELIDQMHQDSVLGVVSVQSFPSLGDDDHRAAFVNMVDIPKTEWLFPIKTNYIKPFLPDTTSELSNLYIPEWLHIAVGMSTLRDASKFRLPYVWSEYNFIPNNIKLFPSDTILNYSVLNNQRMRTYIGFGNTLGLISATTFGTPFSFDSLTNMLNYKNEVWNYSQGIAAKPLASSSNDVVNPDDSSITNIYNLGEKFGSLLANKRPYDWATIYFSESQRNQWLYKPSNQMPGVTDANMERLRLTWVNHLLPIYQAYHTLSNGRNIGSGEHLAYKMPVTMWTQGIDSLQRRLAPEILLYPQTMGSSTDSVNIKYLQSIENIDEINHKIQLDTFVNTGQSDLLIDDGLALTGKVFNLVGLPDAYITSHTDIGDKVLAGFFIPTYGVKMPYYDPNDVIEASSQPKLLLTISLVLDPMWGITRYSYTKEGQYYYRDSLVNLNPIEAASQYDYPALETEPDALVLHIRKNGIFGPSTNAFAAKMYFSDPLMSEEFLEVQDFGNEYRVMISSFKHTAMLRWEPDTLSE
jgi:hypothetical protein